MLKVDLHTHSEASPDGGITSEQYAEAVNNGTLDCIAITDHNRIDYAVKVQAKLGKDKIIIGEEISTKQGEIVGLFLSKNVTPGQDINQSIQDIKSQGGLVYIPHPFETVRSGITEQTLDRIRKDVDIIEVSNGRAIFQNYGPQAFVWAKKHQVSTAASSDAHRASALGKTYTQIIGAPSAKNLVKQLQTPRLKYAKPSLFDIIAPKLNRIKHAIKGGR